MRRFVVGMTGATGAVLGVEVLRELQGCPDVETHLVLSRWARATIHLETELSVRDVESLADVVYSWDEQTAAISSGSFRSRVATALSALPSARNSSSSLA